MYLTFFFLFADDRRVKSSATNHRLSRKQHGQQQQSRQQPHLLNQRHATYTAGAALVGVFVPAVSVLSAARRRRRRIQSLTASRARPAAETHRERVDVTQRWHYNRSQTAI